MIITPNDDERMYAEYLNSTLREVIAMPADSKKLYRLFTEKFHSCYMQTDSKRWDGYLESLGLKSEESDATAKEGLRIPDPFVHWPKQKHITVPEDLAIKILALETLP